MLRETSQRFASALWHRSIPSAFSANLQSRWLKQDTGIVGVPVDPEARTNLRNVIHQVFEAIKGVPEDAYYRQSVEATLQDKLRIVDSDVSDEQAEEQLENQLELVIRQVKDELSLIPKMIEWQPWDVPPDHKIEIRIEEDVPAPASPAPPPPPPPPPKK